MYVHDCLVNLVRQKPGWILHNFVTSKIYNRTSHLNCITALINSPLRSSVSAQVSDIWMIAFPTEASTRESQKSLLLFHKSNTVSLFASMNESRTGAKKRAHSHSATSIMEDSEGPGTSKTMKTVDDISQMEVFNIISEKCQVFVP